MGESVDLAKPQPDQLEPQPHQELIKITEGSPEEPDLKGVGKEFNNLSTEERLTGLPRHFEFYRFTHPARLKLGLGQRVIHSSIIRTIYGHR
jgi:hypothetical protein